MYTIFRCRKHFYAFHVWGKCIALVVMIQHFSFTFSHFFAFATQLFPLRLCHQSSAIYGAPPFTGHPLRMAKIRSNLHMGQLAAFPLTTARDSLGDKQGCQRLRQKLANIVINHCLPKYLPISLAIFLMLKICHF